MVQDLTCLPGLPGRPTMTVGVVLKGENRKSEIGGWNWIYFPVLEEKFSINWFATKTIGFPFIIRESDEKPVGTIL